MQLLVEDSMMCADTLDERPQNPVICNPTKPATACRFAFWCKMRPKFGARLVQNRDSLVQAWCKKGQGICPDLRKFWSGGLDSNQRPLDPQSSALPSCATTRYKLLLARVGTIPQVARIARLSCHSFCIHTRGRLERLPSERRNEAEHTSPAGISSILAHWVPHCLR